MDCSSPTARIEEDEGVVEPGWLVAIFLDGFPSNAAVTVTMLSTDGTSQQVGAGTTDSSGSGVVLADIPLETPPGSFELRVMASEACGASVYIDVIGSLPFIDVDGAFVPGGRLTIFATGFAPDTMVGIYLDGDPRDPLCRCRSIGTARANAEGMVEVRVRIPRDVAPGRHVVVAYGTAVDGSDVTLSIEIILAGAQGTMPPTDTVSAG